MKNCTQWRSPTSKRYMWVDATSHGILSLRCGAVNEYGFTFLDCILYAMILIHVIEWEKDV